MFACMKLCKHACRGKTRTSVSAALVRAAPRVAGLLDSASRSLQFYDAHMQGIAGGQVEEECSICLETLGPADNMSLLRYAHFFHTDCIREVLQVKGECTHCRRQTRPETNEASGVKSE